MKKYLILAAAAALFAACSNDRDGNLSDSPQIPEGPFPLTVGTSFGKLNDPTVSTRSNDVAYQSDALEGSIGLFIFKKNATAKTTPTAETYEQLNLECTTPTQISTTEYYGVSPIVSLYYPDTKSQELDFYAYAPFISATSGSVSQVPASFTDISSQKVTFYTELDQTADADYLASDVLWGCAGTGANIEVAADAASVGAGHADGPYELLKGAGSNQANKNAISASAWQTAKGAYSTAALRSGAFYVESASKADVVIPMLHRGSKIVVQLKTDTSMPYTKLQKAKVSIGIDHKIADLDIATGNFVATDAAAAGYVVLTSRLGWSGTVDEGAYEESSTQVGYQCAAIIIPQEPTAAVAAGKFLKIELGDGSTWTNGIYAWTPASAPEFVSGKVYTYTITVKATGLDVVTTVSDWVAGTTTTADATLQDS